MKSLLAVLLFLAALCSGCAQGGLTRVADAESGKLCRDGVILTPDGSCAAHGGVWASRQ